MDQNERARFYRDRAHELRQLASSFHKNDPRQELLKLADGWDTMADRLVPRPPPEATTAQSEGAQRKAG